MLTEAEFLASVLQISVLCWTGAQETFIIIIIIIINVENNCCL